MADIRSEIEKRRTFAIISHPDAGKTTLTEKFLLYGGAINLAGSVKGKKTAKHAVSDWMEIEKERGISVTSSVLQFNYDGYCINILDTPGHEDFSEDTYRTLMAADSAVMVIDASKGVEKQTIKLFKVCVMRHIPIFTFINKMDREANDPFELLDEIESVYMAGASGFYVDAKKSLNIGQIPPGPPQVYQIGNTSLAMAKDIVLNPELLGELQKLADKIESNHIMLATSEIFEKIYSLELAIYEQGMPFWMYNQWLQKYGIQEIPNIETEPEITKLYQRDIADLGENDFLFNGITISNKTQL